ncbi:MAG: hypothetical protein C4294_06335 [Nitrospiraceae bacterium]
MTKTIEIEIYGQRYVLKGEADEEYVKRVAGYVDEQMRSLAQYCPSAFSGRAEPGGRRSGYRSQSHQSDGVNRGAITGREKALMRGCIRVSVFGTVQASLREGNRARSSLVAVGRHRKRINCQGLIAC